MFMLQHSSSLTGGGDFHISWRSISGLRLQYHSYLESGIGKLKSPYVSIENSTVQCTKRDVGWR